MSLESATAAVREKVGTASGFDASVKFDFGDDGCIVIDGKVDPATVSNDDAEADCTVAMTLEDFDQMLTGDLDPTTAFMMGKLKVSGDMSVAMRLSSVI
ncbi:MAG: SCP2 sterol-binding domain-containing protein [Pseudomonadota bacterium]